MTSQPATTVQAVPAAGTYGIDTQRSTITYTSRHMFGLGTVRAEFSISAGQLESGASLEECGAGAVMDAASFRSGNARRDSDVKAKGLLDVARFPDIVFSSTEVRAADGGMVLVGNVAMHGVVAPVEVRVSSWEQSSSGRIRVLARAEHLDRLSFGITGSRGWVGRYFDLGFDIVAVPAAPGRESDAQVIP
ncbi:YceI family protein [Pseudarthrobacter sp. DSP2-3-2b1]|uniref:YceI family protein n=1 Tax=Pseudarthrobacter sp. DSP2-3-2b1 TaxID=2804661 RepID=UPI003CF31CF0